MRTLAQRREDMQRAIRLQQIEAKFEHERTLLRVVDQAAVTGVVLDSLAGLQLAIDEQDQQAVARHLTLLHNAAMQYAVVDFFLSRGSHPFEIAAENGRRLAMEETWVDIFLQLLRSEEEVVREQASALVRHSLFQIRLAMAERPHSNDYFDQIMRVLDCLPLALLSDRNLKVALNSLESLHELFQAENSSKIVARLLGNHPDFFSVVVELFEAAKEASSTEYSEKVVDTALVVLFVAEQLKYFSALPEVQTLKELARCALVSRIYSGVQDCLFFKKVRALSLCGVSLSSQQLECLLQTTLLKQIGDRNADYLQMVAYVLNTSQLQVSPDALRVFTNALFAAGEGGGAEAEYRRWLAIIVHKNLALFREMARSNINNVVHGWEEPDFSQRLGQVVALAYENNEGFFTILLQICYVLYEAVPLLGPQLHSKLSFLSSYNEWRTLIDSSPLPLETFCTGFS